MGRRFGVLAWALTALVLVECKAKEDDFFAKTFSCVADAANSCGTDRAGVPLICFPANRYGGTDFCAPACDPTGQDTRFTCQDDAWIQVCDPTSPSSPCPRGFTCRPAGPARGLCVLSCAVAGQCAPSTGQGEAGADAPADALPLRDAGSDADGPGETGDLVHCAGSDDACRGVGDGGPMVCVNSAALGGKDFCAEACDPRAPVEDPDHYRCQMGALLHRCRPSTFHEPASDCPQGLNCFRTNLMADEGLCLDMPVCSNADPCASPRICAATFFGGPSARPDLDLDHLNCVIDNCIPGDTTCGNSEACLGTQYAGALAGLCVPRCPDGLCPPNFSCADSVIGQGSDALCLPGVPGAPCGASNCLLGSCEATNAGFSVCAKSCATGEPCAPFSTDPFVCVDWGGPAPHCVTPQPFDGTHCAFTNQCRTDLGQFCSQLDRFGSTMSPGECRVSCKSDGTCDPQGGLPFTCLPFGGAGGCHPGVLGLACKLASECIQDLTCQDVEPELDIDAGAPMGSRICTSSCFVEGGTDLDADVLCNVPNSVVQGGYCARGTCRIPRVVGMPCQRDTQCVAAARCDTSLGQCVSRLASSGP